jgi:hypothetical protein
MNEKNVLDIKGTGKEEQKSLSNFQNYGFVLDGVPCASMEGLLQSLKTKNIALQKEICSRSGLEAKRSFEKKWQNARWKLTGILYWQGKPIRRRSDEYQYFLDRAYDALYTNPDFVSALIKAKGKKLIHSVGKHSTYQTVLTEYEFLSRIEKYRQKALHDSQNEN